jgi:hypothetical protein
MILHLTVQLFKIQFVYVAIENFAHVWSILNIVFLNPIKSYSSLNYITLTPYMKLHRKKVEEGISFDFLA